MTLILCWMSELSSSRHEGAAGLVARCSSTLLTDLAPPRPPAMPGIQDLVQALAPILEHLPLGDVISLRRASRSLREAVEEAWRPRPCRAVVAASDSSRLFLLDPHSGERGAALGWAALLLLFPIHAMCGRAGQVICNAPAAATGEDDESEDEGVADQNGSWVPCVEVDEEGRRLFVSQYQASHVRTSRHPPSTCLQLTATLPALLTVHPYSAIACSSILCLILPSASAALAGS